MKKFYQKWWFWVIIVVLLVLGIIGGIDEHANIISTNNNTLNEEKVIFLKQSNGKEFFKILCDVSQIEYKEAEKIGDSLLYEVADMNYSIEVETNKLNEINYIRLMVFNENDYKNFFLTCSRLEYDGSNREKTFNWINDNLGKEASIKIGDANFKLLNGTNGKPILEIFTDGNEDYQQEQLEKII